MLDLEGARFETPLIKVTGIEIVRSSTPNFCREKLKEGARIILQETPETLREFISVVRLDWMKLEIEDMAFPRGVNGIEKYMADNSAYLSGTPIHVRASIMYNKLLKDFSLEKKYERIRSGDKVKFYLLWSLQILVMKMLSRSLFSFLRKWDCVNM